MQQLLLSLLLLVLIIAVSSVPAHRLPSLTETSARQANGDEASLVRLRRAACGSVDCQNGGVCNMTGATPSCVCPKPYALPICAVVASYCYLSQPDKGIDPSVSPICMNGGTCTGTTFTDPWFNCNCVPGYNGSRCESNIDDCARKPCVNGICTDLLNNYSCGCYSGWQGRNCDVNINDCFVGACMNAGRCIDGNGSFTCDCTGTGFNGSRCEFDVNECNSTSNPCSHGFCRNLYGSYNCSCYIGWEGTNCQVNHDDCLPGSCQNGGRCVDGNSSITCDCSSVDYQGSNCSSWINDCLPSPCLNGGSCSDRVRNFSCNCSDTGFSGFRCETNVDDCVSNPCIFGTCIDLWKNYTCNCTNTGFYGRNCNLNIDDCSPNPCLNDGRCYDAVKDFSCSCYDGYTGRTCQVDTPDCEPNPCGLNGTCLERSKQDLYGIAKLPSPFTGRFDRSLAAGFVCLSGPDPTPSQMLVGLGIGIAAGITFAAILAIIIVLAILTAHKQGKMSFGRFESDSAIEARQHGGREDTAAKSQSTFSCHDNRNMYDAEVHADVPVPQPANAEEMHNVGSHAEARYATSRSWQQAQLEVSGSCPEASGTAARGVIAPVPGDGEPGQDYMVTDISPDQGDISQPPVAPERAGGEQPAIADGPEDTYTTADVDGPQPQRQPPRKNPLHQTENPKGHGGIKNWLNRGKPTGQKQTPPSATVSSSEKIELQPHSQFGSSHGGDQVGPQIHEDTEAAAAFVSDVGTAGAEKQPPQQEQQKPAVSRKPRPGPQQPQQQPPPTVAPQQHPSRRPLPQIPAAQTQVADDKEPPEAIYADLTEEASSARLPHQQPHENQPTRVELSKIAMF